MRGGTPRWPRRAAMSWDALLLPLVVWLACASSGGLLPNAGHVAEAAHQVTSHGGGCRRGGGGGGGEGGSCGDDTSSVPSAGLGEILMMTSARGGGRAGRKWLLRRPGAPTRVALALRGGKGGSNKAPKKERRGEIRKIETTTTTTKKKVKKRSIEDSMHDLEGDEDEDDTMMHDAGNSGRGGRASKEAAATDVDEEDGESSGLDVPVQKIWCGPQASDSALGREEREAMHAHGDGAGDEGKGKDSDELVYVSTDDADADVVLRPGGEGEGEWMHTFQQEEGTGTGMETCVVDGNIAVNMGWKAGITKGSDQAWHVDEETGAVTPGRSQVVIPGEEGAVEEGEDSQYEWFLTSEPDPTGIAPSWTERMSEKMLRNETHPNVVYFLAKDGTIHVPQVREFEIPPSPTPGVAPEDGGASWVWDEVDTEKMVFRGHWDPAVVDRVGEGQAAMDALEAALTEVAKPFPHKLDENEEGGFSEEFLAEAEAADPGARQWLEAGQVELHSQRHDFEEYPEGPPLELIEAEYGEGGHKAIYNIPEDGELVDGKVPRFQPEFFDIREYLDRDKTSNVSTIEECAELGRIPGWQEAVEEEEEEEANERGTPMLLDPEVVQELGLCRAFLLKKRGNGDAKKAVWEQKDIQPLGQGWDDDVGEKDLERLRGEISEMWCWIYVEGEIERLVASDDAGEREAGEGLREAADTSNYTPAFLQLWEEAEEIRAKKLAAGEELEFPEWMPSVEEVHKHQRLRRVFEARCGREEHRREGGDLKHQGRVNSKHPVDLYDLLREKATPEERTRWPYVPIPHWTYDITKDSKRNSVGNSAIVDALERAEGKQAEAMERRAENAMREHGDDRCLDFSQLDEARQDELIKEVVDEVVAVEVEGTKPKPQGWLTFKEELTTAGLDPYKPLMPLQYGEGIHAWGPHPEGRKCGNTYCRHCYTTTHEGEQINNPKFQGRLLSDLSNDELHELGINPYYASLPKHVYPTFRDPGAGGQGPSLAAAD